MANEYTVNAADLTAVADAIRAKTGTSEGLSFPDGFEAAIAGISTGAQVASGTVVLPGNARSFTITPGFKVKKLCIGTSDADGSGLYVNGTIDTTKESGIQSVSSTEAETTVTFTSTLNRMKVDIWWMAST